MPPVDNFRSLTFPATRQLYDNELNAVINALDGNKDKVLQRNELTIVSAATRARLDVNRDGRFSSDEVKAGFQADALSISFTGARGAAVDVLLKMDANQDGYLAENELGMNQKMMNQLDGYGSRKYGADNGRTVIDSKGRNRATGAAGQDSRISISEMANAMADGLLKIGQRITLMNRS